MPKENKTTLSIVRKLLKLKEGITGSKGVNTYQPKTTPEEMRAIRQGRKSLEKVVFPLMETCTALHIIMGTIAYKVQTSLEYLTEMGVIGEYPDKFIKTLEKIAEVANSLQDNFKYFPSAIDRPNERITKSHAFADHDYVHKMKHLHTGGDPGKDNSLQDLIILIETQLTPEYEALSKNHMGFYDEMYKSMVIDVQNNVNTGRTLGESIKERLPELKGLKADLTVQIGAIEAHNANVANSRK